MSRKLMVAILLWKRGQPIPTDLWFTLAAEGYDMQTLEAKHSL